MKAKKEKLIPPDLERCQTEITPAHGAFVLGPRPRPERCTNKPTWLASDGVGSMSLCDHCKTVCEKQMPKAKFKQITRDYTVLGVYGSSEAGDYGERFADHVRAASPAEAEKKVHKKRRDAEILIAGVLEGKHRCVDTQP